MFSSSDYQLLDFGDGRKLERFGPLVLDRPAPAAEGRACADPQVWANADGRFERISAESGRWTWRKSPPDDWAISHQRVQFRLKATDFGHVGLFPEQAENWDWIARKAASAGRTIRVLNLFAYTGGSTLAAAAAGAEVTHVDAAKNVVAWARENAKRSGLAAAPIRWIAEDAAKFVRREMRRKNTYDAVILDPPSYGHGPKGEAWKLASDLPPLLTGCAQLLAPRPAFFLLTCHTPGFGPAELEALVSSALFGACQQGVTARNLTLAAADGRRLACGALARWPEIAK